MNSDLNNMYGDNKIKKQLPSVIEKRIKIHRSFKIQKLVIEGEEIWFPSIDYVHDLENEIRQLKEAFRTISGHLRELKRRR